ncbi:hypothetical protein NA57DRAFT_80089 [Rhizodiscina lignyota]|uniref:Uncharacterized protein n=1 Tax=Rhizodiscina lignyota TaxID=1504668 RepID=A0A9P4IAD2_9PEZI|nr:hypothetical protein NA57DRAFT_80089 [Rhizodiscina lignyota]
MDSTLNSAQTQELPTPITSLPTPPPAYTRFSSPFSGSDLSEDPDMDTPTTTFRIDATTTIQGSNNVVSLVDSTRLIAMFSAALVQARAQAPTENNTPRNINVELNCGITIVGDRNIVGSLPTALAIRRRQAVAAAAAKAASMAGATSTAEAQANAGVKRKAEDDGEESEERNIKKVAVA